MAEDVVARGRRVTASPLTPELVERRLGELAAMARLGASLLEAELPPIERGVLERRSLRVEGRAAGAAAPSQHDPRDVRLLVASAAVDRPLGWMPDCWIDPGDGRIVEGGLAVLVTASADGSAALDALPRGRAGTVTLRFLLGRPACLDALPALERHDGQVRLWACMARDRARARW
jgi:hypothetical protein